MCRSRLGSSFLCRARQTSCKSANTLRGTLQISTCCGRGNAGISGGQPKLRPGSESAQRVLQKKDMGERERTDARTRFPNGFPCYQPIAFPHRPLTSPARCVRWDVDNPNGFSRQRPTAARTRKSPPEKHSAHRSGSSTIYDNAFHATLHSPLLAPLEPHVLVLLCHAVYHAGLLCRVRRVRHVLHRPILLIPETPDFFGVVSEAGVGGLARSSRQCDKSGEAQLNRLPISAGAPLAHRSRPRRWRRCCRGLHVRDSVFPLFPQPVWKKVEDARSFGPTTRSVLGLPLSLLLSPLIQSLLLFSAAPLLLSTYEVPRTGC